MSRRLLPCGEHAVLVELEGLDEVISLARAVNAAVEAGDTPFVDVVDVVPAARTLLVVVRDGTEIAPVRGALPTLPVLARPTLSANGSAGSPGEASGPGRPHVVEILVHYDGPDLDEVAELTGLSPKEVVAAHTQTLWQVAFSGFSPGFAYLAGGDDRLRVPRRREPRTSVAAGSVGLAGEFSAVYPRTSPGGWQLLGHTDEILWDVERRPPALLQPGSAVRFVDADIHAAGTVR